MRRTVEDVIADFVAGKPSKQKRIVPARPVTDTTTGVKGAKGPVMILSNGRGRTAGGHRHTGRRRVSDGGES